MRKFAEIVVVVVMVALLQSLCCAGEWVTASGTGQAYDNSKVVHGYHYSKTYGLNQPNTATFTIGKVKLSWWPNKETYFYVSLRENPRPLAWCILPPGKKLDDLKNPPALKFMEAGEATRTRQFGKYVNGKLVLSKPTTNIKPLPAKFKGVVVDGGEKLDKNSLWGMSGVGFPIIFRVNDNYFVGFEATKITDMSWPNTAYKSGYSKGGVMEYKWMTWTWDDKGDIAQAER
jgi:hypothetical protein